MKKYCIYFVDCNGYGGSTSVEAKNETQAKKEVLNYCKIWGLLPISDLDIKEV